MLLRPSNTLLLDEPTNHLDLDSKDVLLEALEDYGGTLIFVSHDRYFVERLATKIVEIGHGEALVFPGTYPEFLWSKEHAEKRRAEGTGGARGAQGAKSLGLVEAAPAAPQQSAKAIAKAGALRKDGSVDHEVRKRERAHQRRRDQELQRLQAQITDLEGRISQCEQAIKDIEAAMSAPGFYDARETAQPLVERHQALMWEVGDLMHQWEELQKRLPPVTESRH
jgi:ATP-binding cassette subfamily F protein 3